MYRYLISGQEELMSYTGLVLVLLIVLTFVIHQSRAVYSQDMKQTDESTIHMTPARYPVIFQYPHIESQSERLQDIKPIPYRPFRWGQYHITMGIRAMPWSDWIELDCEFAVYHKIRQHRIQARNEKAVNTLSARPGLVDGGHAAAFELVQELSEYLSRRYPDTFAIQRHNAGNLGWAGKPLVKSITIKSFGQTYNLEAEGDMMRIAASLVQEDIAIMIEGTDGRYYFQAGAICVPGFWRMEDKIGLALDEIHNHGHVPQYPQKLQGSLERFFKRLPVNKPVVRNNYSLQLIDDCHKSSLDLEDLAWSETMNGPEDQFSDGHRDRPDKQPNVSPQNLRLRTERQTLRRLPRTGAIVFGIRTYLTPITSLAEEPGIPGRMASALRSWPDDVAVYKGKATYAKVLLDYLDERHRQQIEAKVYNPDALPDNNGYPF